MTKSEQHAQHVISTIQHLRFDFEDACNVEALLIALDDIAEQADSVAGKKDILGSLSLLQKSLVGRLILTLARAYDPWTKKNPDRMSLPAIYWLVDNDLGCKKLLITEVDLEKSYKNARKSYKRALRAQSFRGVEFAIENHSKLSPQELDEELSKFFLTKLIRTPRDQVLAHNLRDNGSMHPTVNDLKMLLDVTLEQVEILSSAFGGISVRFDAARAVSRKRATRFSASFGRPRP